MDECAEDNGGCSQFATCANVPDSFYCMCNLGYTGDGFTCSGNINICYPLVFCPTNISKIVQLTLRLTLVYITGCAVAQHCCNDDQQSQWENGDFDPL